MKKDIYDRWNDVNFSRFMNDDSSENDDDRIIVAFGPVKITAKGFKTFLKATGVVLGAIGINKTIDYYSNKKEENNKSANRINESNNECANSIKKDTAETDNKIRLKELQHAQALELENLKYRNKIELQKSKEKKKTQTFSEELLSNPLLAEGDDEIENNDVIEEIDEPLNLPEKILPYEVVALDFIPDAIWQAYLLKTTDYYIGQRWHGGYHEMTIPQNLEELMNFRPWKENEIQEYEKFINKTKFDFEPQITIDGNVATIEHLAVFFHNNISRCRATVFYNSETRRIESFEFDSTDLFTFSQHYVF